ncbi:MAG: glycoside hydrolase family 130 protein [Clostridia bacterium]|nr:glycoside hydrolase family 130 protein [Clostridia bacterium]
MNFYSKKNPLLTKEKVKSRYQDTEAIGVFNPAATQFEDETVLLVRIAERVKENGGRVGVPMIEKGAYVVKYFSPSDPNYDFSDARVVKGKNGKYLTSMSYLAVARSKDGENFILDENCGIFPETEYEAYGVEDARISVIDGKYYITYTAVSDLGICVALATTKDFKTFEKKGVLLTPDNKDVAFFPEKMGGKYYMLHRPSTSEFGKPEAWLAQSSDMLEWGRHVRVLGVRKDRWDSERLGVCSAPIKTEDGWLTLYHGADKNNRYCVGAILLDRNDPSKVLKRSAKPFLEPINDYEQNGFFGGVVFPCGAVKNGDSLWIYYGAADDKVCLVKTPIKDILDTLV